MMASMSGRPWRAARTGRLRTAAHTNPGAQPTGFDGRIDPVDRDRRPRLARPADRTALEERDEQIQPLFEEQVVL
jgi:hypothetical protein